MGLIIWVIIYNSYDPVWYNFVMIGGFHLVKLQSNWWRDHTIRNRWFHTIWNCCLKSSKQIKFWLLKIFFQRVAWTDQTILDPLILTNQNCVKTLNRYLKWFWQNHEYLYKSSIQVKYMVKIDNDPIWSNIHLSVWLKLFDQSPSKKIFASW